MSFQLARTILALVLTFSVREGTLGGPDEITWFSNYDAARAYARQNGQPLLVSFRCVP